MVSIQLIYWQDERQLYLPLVGTAERLGSVRCSIISSRILPMFHAAGWTFPWSCSFSFATQVKLCYNVFKGVPIIEQCTQQITLRTVNFTHIWKHFLHSGVTHYCAAPTVQVNSERLHVEAIFSMPFSQIGIVNDPHAKKPPQVVTAIIGRQC